MHWGQQDHNVDKDDFHVSLMTEVNPLNPGRTSRRQKNSQSCTLTSTHDSLTHTQIYV